MENAGLNFLNQGPVPSTDVPWGKPNDIYHPRLGVFKAIHKVSAELSKLGIDKRSKNAAQGFNFRGIDDVLNVLSAQLVDAGLIILPFVVNRIQTERTTKAGSTQYHVSLLVDFHLTAVEDGSVSVVRMAGEAADTADKATSKAMSMAYKYMAFDTFCIPVAGLDDADATSPEATYKAPPQGRTITPTIIEQIALAKDLDALLALKQQVAKYAKDPDWKEIKAAYAAKHGEYTAQKEAA
jgi:hypothetical protein